MSDIIPVFFLEEGDVGPDGNLPPSLSNGQTIVMVKANFCGACKNAWPSFVDTAKELHSDTLFATIIADESDGLKDMANQLLGEPVEGFPTYLLFQNGELVGKKVGGKQKKSLYHMLGYSNRTPGGSTSSST